MSASETAERSMTTERDWPRALTLVCGLLVGGLLVAGCSPGEDGDPDTGDAAAIGADSAEALRDAGSFRFEFTAAENTTEGSIVYEDGQVAAIQVTQRDGEDLWRDWWVNGTYWTARDERAAPSPDTVENAESFVAAFDWALLQEDIAAAATSVQSVGTDEIDGVEVTGVEITGPERTEIWWLDEADLLRGYEFSTADGSEGEGRLFDFGADVGIAVPLTSDTIGTVTAAALQSTGTFGFAQETEEGSQEGAVRYVEGELDALEVTTTDTGGTITRREWWVDEEYWVAEGGGEPELVQPDATAPMPDTWDWAHWQEQLAADASAIEEAGVDEIDGVAVTGYQLALDGWSETWWVGPAGLLRAIDYDYPDGTSGRAVLTDHGADVDITVPEA
ncbi:hypothetical protein IM660_17385 [Ruania alkalisoli]|uniref:Uncharacterized protein n=1 Tax=Ruania alkalisoli TaxID=2779775 RepID=A0A7M1SS08_9MICO|nr:hypothetical protein [Ruania alkalisoli]QOR70346.1 hypothetical protein IM660_17385 [Ruania alkalisoli]